MHELISILGDRIMSVSIDFSSMTYEDALTILSYAAPYPMTLKLSRGSNKQNHASSDNFSEVESRIYHPVYRSQSVGAGTNHSKKQRKMPSRPGTSLSQMDYSKLFTVVPRWWAGEKVSNHKFSCFPCCSI